MDASIIRMSDSFDAVSDEIGLPMCNAHIEELVAVGTPNTYNTSNHSDCEDTGCASFFWWISNSGL